jgi:putative phosphoserine phosphatase/1-acylglycerol-3-phosphate O-acyltransferase
MRVLTSANALGEVVASASGPRIGAFFDLDGTLIEGFSASVFAKERLRNREIGLAEVGRTVRLAVNFALGRAGFEDFLSDSGQAFRGRSQADLVAMGDRLFETNIAKLMYREMRAIVKAHQERAHTLVLASSATSFQAQPVATALGIEHIVCNRMAVDDDEVLTGELTTPIVWGGGKASAVQALAQRLDVDLAASFFYADGDEDTALMHLVGRPRPVNPKRHLAIVADRRGWPVLKL